jgi:MarR family transcriptional regulator for hemolysin
VGIKREVEDNVVVPAESHVPVNVGLLLHQAQLRATHPLNATLEPLGLAARHFAVMLLMHRDGLDTQRDFVRALIADKSGMVRIVDDLERLEYVARTRSTKDRRVTHLALTTKGVNAFEEATARTQKVVDVVFAPLSVAELATFERMLQRLVATEMPMPTASGDFDAAGAATA